MSALSRALFMGGRVKGWAFIGATAVQTAATLNLPNTAAPGDVAILASSATASGSAPSGWTSIAGTSLNYYKICAGGETTVANPISGGRAVVMLFRPVAGTANLSVAQTTTGLPPANIDLTLTALPSLVILLGASVANGTFNINTLPPGNIEIVNDGTQPALYVSYAIFLSGATTGNMRVYNGQQTRNTAAAFHLT